MTTGFTLSIQANDPLPWMGKDHALEVGKFTYIGNSFAVRLIQTGSYTYALRRENGAVGREPVGGFFYGTMTLRCPSYVSVVPQKHVEVFNDSEVNQIVMGLFSGGEYMQPRDILTVRFVLVPWWRRLLSVFPGMGEPWRAVFALRGVVSKHAHLALPKSLQHLKGKFDGIGERILAAMKAGVADPSVLLLNVCGERMPMGDMDKGAVGGGGIEPHPGYERSPLFRLLSHDRTMNRMPVSYVDATTGAPITTRRHEYFTSRGWNVSTQLSDFCDPFRMGDDRRFPKNLNTGTCPYIDKLVPTTDATFYGSRYLPYDDEHLVRATRHAKCAAILYGDPVAQLDLEMIAADAWVGVHFFDKDTTIFGQPVARYPDGKGCDRYGRGWAWSLNALQAANVRWSNYAASEMVAELIRVQDIETGSFHVCQPPPNEPKGWSPSPYYLPSIENRDPAKSMPLDKRVAHTLEVAYLGMGVAHATKMSAASKAAWFFSYRSPQQWIAVEPFSEPQVGEMESFSCWCLWAMLAAHDPAWKARLERFLPPGAPALAGPNVLDSLLSAGNYDASAKAIETCEVTP